jgi:hypothetical protein
LQVFSFFLQVCGIPIEEVWKNWHNGRENIEKVIETYETRFNWRSGSCKRGINLSNTFIAAGKSAQTTDMKGFLKNGT